MNDSWNSLSENIKDALTKANSTIISSPKSKMHSEFYKKSLLNNQIQKDDILYDSFYDEVRKSCFNTSLNGTPVMSARSINVFNNNSSQNGGRNSNFFNDRYQQRK